MPSYKSVTEQAGIYAGKEGFDIKVENNTDLKGAVIASEADADKNTLTTGTISFSDIKNEAEYDTKGIGMTLDANKTSGNQPSTVGQKGLIPSVPAKVSDSAESTTKSGVSGGKINVTKPEKQKQDVNTLNRDTKNTLNKLDKIFDIEKIREDQETAALFGELAANGIHVLAEKNKWKNDDPEKIALHAAVGAVVASITKGNIASGALAGGATEYLAQEILKVCKGDKALAQWVAMIVGAALSEATGGDAQQGAFVAVNAIQNNLFWDNVHIDEDTLEKISELPEGYAGISTLELGPASEAMIIVHSGDDPDNYPVFLSWGSEGIGKSMIDAGMKFGKGCLVDRYGSTVTERETIIDKLPGWGLDIEASAIIGGAISSPFEDKWENFISKLTGGERSILPKDMGYKFISIDIGFNASMGVGVSKTIYIGNVAEVNENMKKPVFRRIIEWIIGQEN